ncbi:GSCOCG00010863001-RA-CDS [Cotesia congregata]|nr:GSCOCG00010863001-RA-CDS [Cotesia congregata]
MDEINFPYFDDIDTENLNSDDGESVNNFQTHDIIEPSQDDIIEPSKLNTMKPSVMFAAKLHSFLDIPRTKVESIIRDADIFLQNSLQNLKNNVLQATSLDDKKIMEKIEEVFKQSKSSFEEIKTEQLCLRKFKECNTFIEPIAYCFGEREKFVHEENHQVLKLILVTAQFILIRHVFQKLFEIPGLLDATMEYVNSLLIDGTFISNFIQSNLWRELSSKFKDNIVFPVFLYFDDYENNPLGSHRGISKCGAVYLKIPCLPPHLSSKLENIFLFILFNTLDRKIFSVVLDELKLLEKKGITIDLSGEQVKIYFKLALITGDNLGVYSMLGFTESFNSSSFCKFCKVKKIEFKKIFRES